MHKTPGNGCFVLNSVERREPRQVVWRTEHYDVLPPLLIASHCRDTESKCGIHLNCKNRIPRAEIQSSHLTEATTRVTEQTQEEAEELLIRKELFCEAA